MPRKKTTNNKKSQVQKQKIAARLLEISFKADDYIYKKKSISVEHAKKYLEEVEKFEPKCQGDVRSLQVIEKLTHLMKSIIEQDKTSQGASQSSYNPFNITSTNASPTSGTTVKSTRSTHVQTNKSFEIRNIIEYLENTGEVNKTNTESERMQVVETEVNIDLERTLSNLSLSIIDPFNKEIVENVNNLTNIEEINFPIQTIDNYTILNENGNINTDVCDQASKDQTDTNKNGMQNDTTTKTRPNIIMINLVDDDNDCQHSVVNDCQHSVVNNKASNIALTDEKIVKHNIDKTKKLNMQVNKIDTEKKKDSKTQGKDGKKQKRNTKNNKPRKPRRNSKVCFDTILSKEKTENKNKRRRKSTKEIVCDLSWVENIKFVRVIEPSEYDTSLELQESFWENCYLPYDFSQYF